jgi:threonine aldolase
MDRLAEDHANAHAFATSLASVEGVTIGLDAVQTNIVYFHVDDPGHVVNGSLDKGVAMLVSGHDEVRAVFSLAVDGEGTAEAIDVVTAVVETVS